MDFDTDTDQTDDSGDTSEGADDLYGADASDADGGDGDQTDDPGMSGDDGDQPGDNADSQGGQWDDQGDRGDTQADEGGIGDQASGSNGSDGDTGYTADQYGDSLINGASPRPDVQDRMERAERDVNGPVGRAIKSGITAAFDAGAGVVNAVGSLEGHALGGVYSLLGHEQEAQHWHEIAGQATDDAGHAVTNVFKDLGLMDGERESTFTTPDNPNPYWDKNGDPWHRTGTSE
jgi:hypothetical protein